MVCVALNPKIPTEFKGSVYCFLVPNSLYTEDSEKMDLTYAECP